MSCASPNSAWSSYCSSLDLRFALRCCGACAPRSSVSARRSSSASGSASPPPLWRSGWTGAMRRRSAPFSRCPPPRSCCRRWTRRGCGAVLWVPAFGVLLFQDLSVIPLLVLLPMLAVVPVVAVAGADGGLHGWWHALAVLAAVLAIVAGGRYLIGPI